ncbi:MAG: VWA domain-containing protein [Bradyrhizobiaceae bacterium]|nr:MAG: VWA domain-containing protein [Bradyrhizobiaceae bacterium]
MAALRKSSRIDVGFSVRLRVAGFLRTLRDNGFRVGLAESRDVLKIVADAGMDRPSSVKPALKALLCSRRSDWDAFDDLFDAFWLGRGVKTRTTVNASRSALQKNMLNASPQRGGTSPDDGLASDVERSSSGQDSDEAELKGKREGASRFDNLAHTDFRKIADPDAIAEANALAERLARTMRARITRRDRKSQRGRQIDLRRTIRASLQTGGVPLDLIRRRPHNRPLRLVVLLDASGSMSLYTAVFVRFVHGILDHFLEADAFLFHTQLVHVSDALREKDAGRALDRLGLMAQGVGGGTKIGESLATFNRWHAARVIHSRTCVMILSDGYDTGEPEHLKREMAALRRRCKRIVWLNPMIGWEGYEPSARGMAAALPYVDLFAPAHTLDSLAALEPYLARI